MGLLFSRFRRKQTTIEILEGIDKEITRLQRNRKVDQNRQKQFVTSLLIYSIAAYVIAAVIFFCIYFPETWQLRLLYSLPLMIFPFLIWGIKKLLHWYFVQRISSNDLALQDLRERKNQILEDMMENETYKKAREILQRFDPDRLRKLEGVREAAPSYIGSPGTEIQQRTFQTADHVPIRTPGPSSPRPGPSTIIQRQNGAASPTFPVFQQGVAVPQPRQLFPSQAVMGAPVRPPMPRSVLPRERGVMDRLMDYLVGDGPENRYALICWQCCSHNGMALKEEFEYLSFRCCYCYTINPARQQRPTAPRLEFFAPPGLERHKRAGSASSSENSDDERCSQQGSSKSDTSQGISPIQSVESAMVSLPASSKSSPWQYHSMTSAVSNKEQDKGTGADVTNEPKSPNIESEELKPQATLGEVLTSGEITKFMDQVLERQEPNVAEVKMTNLTEVTQELEDSSNPPPSAQLLYERHDVPEIVQSQKLTESTEDLRNVHDSYQDCLLSQLGQFESTSPEAPKKENQSIDNSKTGAEDDRDCKDDDVDVSKGQGEGKFMLDKQ